MIAINHTAYVDFPRRLGGGAPTPEEAEVLEKAERARREAGDR